MPTVVDAGTITTDGSEQTLSSPILNRSYVLWLDFNALTGADSMRIRAKRKVLSSGTVRKFAEQVYTSTQDPPVQCLVPVALFYGGEFTIQRIAGSDRAIPWSLESL